MTDIAIADIPAALVDIHAKLVEKLGAQPLFDPYLSIKQNGKWSITLWKAEASSLLTCHESTPAQAILVSLQFIASMVGSDEQSVIDWQESLASVIDEGHDLNLPDTVLAPLRASSQAMTENLIGVAK
jgi:hypothetical protein